MCLVKIEKTARIATASLKVYKILSEYDCSPFQEYRYHRGKNTPLGYDIFSSAGMTIDVGYLHAYLTKSQASKKLAWIQNSYYGVRLKVVEMYIPVGTEYWLGEGEEVAARCLEWSADTEEWIADTVWPDISQ